MPDPKANFFITVRANDTEGNVRGHFELTSGNLYYYKKFAKEATCSLTWNQLMELLEKQNSVAQE